MGHIVDDKEKNIMYEEWKCPHPRATLVLVHGLGACTSRWNFLAEFFLTHNISSYAIMLKGFGKTSGPRGHADSFNTYIHDVRELCEIVKKENPVAKVFALGESMGALGIGCPEGPQGLTVLQSGASLDLTWSAPPSPRAEVDHYVVYRDTTL